MPVQTKQPIQQGIQPAGIPQTSQTDQQTPVQTKTQPAQPEMPAATTPGAQPSTQPVKKKSKWWIWLIIILVIIGAAAAAYFIFIR